MRDTVNMIKQGVPSVVLVHEPFEKLARAQMRQLGIADSKPYVVSYPVDRPAADSPEFVRKKADELARRLPDFLTSQEWPTGVE